MKEIQGDFIKIKPPTFDGEMRSKEELETWLSWSKCFQIYSYSNNLKAKMDTYNLNCRDAIWWNYLKFVHHPSARKLIWKQFKNPSKEKYMSEWYYKRKIKEFHELKLWYMNMDDFSNKFIEMLRYVPYLKDEKIKIQ